VTLVWWQALTAEQLLKTQLGGRPMETKILEVRDVATFIPVLATAMKSDNPIEKWYLKRTGYPENHPLVMIAPMYGGKAEYGPYKWGESPRTLFIAHKYIEENRVRSSCLVWC
jgi:hypothetical protein